MHGDSHVDIICLATVDSEFLILHSLKFVRNLIMWSSSDSHKA